MLYIIGYLYRTYIVTLNSSESVLSYSVLIYCLVFNSVLQNVVFFFRIQKLLCSLLLVQLSVISQLSHSGQCGINMYTCTLYTLSSSTHLSSHNSLLPHISLLGLHGRMHKNRQKLFDKFMDMSRLAK